MKTISFGGLGDSVIISAKLNKLSKDNKIKHLFVESSKRTLDLIRQYVSTLSIPDVLYNFEVDENYQQNYLSGHRQEWSEMIPLNTSVSGEYPFPARDGIKLSTKDFPRPVFVHSLLDNQKKYDIAIQCSAGVNSDRNWKFNPISFAKLLRKNKKLKVCIVGSDTRYQDNSDSDNFVCKTNLVNSMKHVASSKIYIGLSGFHNYWSAPYGVKNILVEESPEHTKHWLVPELIDKNKIKIIKYGTVKEVLDEIEKT